jgi:hypothetical protein
VGGLLEKIKATARQLKFLFVRRVSISRLHPLVVGMSSLPIPFHSQNREGFYANKTDNYERLLNDKSESII